MIVCTFFTLTDSMHEHTVLMIFLFIWFTIQIYFAIVGYMARTYELQKLNLNSKEMEVFNRVKRSQEMPHIIPSEENNFLQQDFQVSY